MDELKSRITYREFLEWLFFLEQEEQRQTKQDYYLAQIAAEVRRGHVKNPRSVKVKDFLIQFRKSGVGKLPKDDSEQRMEKSKAAWFAALGIKKKP